MYRSFTSKALTSIIVNNNRSRTAFASVNVSRNRCLHLESSFISIRRQDIICSPSCCFDINTNSSSSKRSYTINTRHVDMPMKTIEVFSLHGDSTKGRVIEQVASIGSYVETGDVVTIVQTENGNICEIRSPDNGQVTQLLANINDEVIIGDKLFTINTDYNNKETSSDDSTKNQIIQNDSNGSSSIDPNAQLLIEYLQSNNGQLDDTFMNEFLQYNNDIHRLRSFAFLLRDQFPNLIHKSLTVLEYMKNIILQQEQDNNDKTNAKKIELAIVYTDIGITNYRLGDLDAALLNFETALQLRIDSLGSNNHIDLIGSYIHLGAVKNKKGDLHGTYDDFIKVLEIQRQQYGIEHTSIASTLNSLGAIMYQMQDYNGALKHYKEAVNILEKIVGEHPETAGCYNNIGIALKHIGDNRGALEHCRKALMMRQNTLGNKHHDTAASHYSLGQMLSELNEYEGSIEQYELALQIHIDSYGDSPITASTRNNIGAVHYQNHEYDKALEQYNIALQIMKNKLGINHIEVATCLNNVGLAYYQKRELDIAMPFFQEALVIMKDNYGNDDIKLASTIGSIGNILKNKGQYDEALIEYRIAHTMLENSLGLNHPDVGSSFNNMGQALAGQGKYDDAITVYNAGRKIIIETLGPEHPNTGSCCFNIALVYYQKNDKNNALLNFRNALDIWSPIFGPNHPQTKAAQQYIHQLS